MLENHLTLRDGEKVFIRPLKVEDAALYPDFLAEVTPDDLRLRFFAPMREVSHDLIDKLIHYDPGARNGFHCYRRGERPHARCGAPAR